MGINANFNYGAANYSQLVQRNVGNEEVSTVKKTGAEYTETEGDIRRTERQKGENKEYVDTIAVAKKSLAQTLEEIKALPREKVQDAKEEVIKTIRSDSNAINIQGNFSPAKISELLAG